MARLHKDYEIYLPNVLILIMLPFIYINYILIQSKKSLIKKVSVKYSNWNGLDTMNEK